MKKIYSELARIQQELKAPKNLWNKFGQYYYRNAEGILEAVKPMLNGLVLIINDEPVVIGERFYIKATVTLTDGEESISVVAYAREDEIKKGMDGCQITGACSSYARKYALNALLMIDDSKDSDDDSLSPRNPANQDNGKTPANQDSSKKPDDSKNQGSKPVKPTKPVNPAADVSMSRTLPQEAQIAGKQPADQPDENPVQAYLLKEMKELRESRGISARENNELFKKQHEVLIKGGLAPNKSLSEYTMSEAQDLIAAMYANFSPEGTELK